MFDDNRPFVSEREATYLIAFTFFDLRYGLRRYDRKRLRRMMTCHHHLSESVSILSTRQRDVASYEKHILH